MDDNIEVMLFRAARELLLNVAFHSNATNAVVTLSDNDDCISISVKDNGVGFDLTKIDTTVSDPSGFGIFSIRERMLHLGGRFEIKSAPGQGTQVTIVSPKRYY
jgi:signal transduction histidine kinase